MGRERHGGGSSNRSFSPTETRPRHGCRFYRLSSRVIDRPWPERVFGECIGGLGRAVCNPTPGPVGFRRGCDGWVARWSAVEGGARVSAMGNAFGTFTNPHKVELSHGMDPGEVQPLNPAWWRSLGDLRLASSLRSCTPPSAVPAGCLASAPPSTYWPMSSSLLLPLRRRAIRQAARWQGRDHLHRYRGLGARRRHPKPRGSAARRGGQVRLERGAAAAPARSPPATRGSRLRLGSAAPTFPATRTMGGLVDVNHRRPASWPPCPVSTPRSLIPSLTPATASGGSSPPRTSPSLSTCLRSSSATAKTGCCSCLWRLHPERRDRSG